MKRIFVLGHKGMLGHVVARYLRERGHEVLTTDKRFEAGHDCQMLREVSLSDADVIINCIGKIRQKTGDHAELFLANTVLPIQVLQRLAKHQRFIQISSDCVFSGQKNTPYDTCDIPDPIDAYGASKAAGEIVALDSRAIVIRTSIIGPELGTSFGLFSWFVNNTSSKLSGYTNHLWNGVTTLQLAKVIESMLEPGQRPFPIITHAVCEAPVSKHTLLCQINTIWSLKKQIGTVKTAQGVNHILRNNVSIFPETFERDGPSIEQQLKELKEWY